MTPTKASPLPRPRSCEFEIPPVLPRKSRTPDKADGSEKRRVLVEEDVVPMRPSKRSTPRRVSLSSKKRDTPGSISSVGHHGRTESLFGTYFKNPVQVGSGSFARVFNAQYVVDGNNYAVKVYEQHHYASENEMKQVNFLTQHPHPNCLRYHCAWRDASFGEFAVVTELCEKGSLKTVMAERALTEEEIWSYFLDALQGLAHIHAFKLRHFDIKPDNLFITANDELRIGDFGVATVEGATMDYSTGTKPYYAPEMLSSPSEAITTAADMYSIGVVLYEMVSDYDLSHDAKQWQAPPPDRQFQVLTSLCEELMSKNPTARPTARQLLDRPGLKERAEARLALITSRGGSNGTTVFELAQEMSAAVANAMTSTETPAIVRNLFE